jgi:phenylalanine-4-hydroxylase
MTAKFLPDTFSDEDSETWSILIESCRDRLRQHGCAQAIAGFKALGLSEQIEPMSVLNDRLHSLSGWRMQPVDGLISDQEFYQLLSDRLFPTAPALRKRSELEFSEYPDLFHDVVGHLPVLLDRAYGDFIKGLADIALRYLDSKPITKALARFYWFTAETGLVRENGQLKIFGGAVLTSAAESARALDAATRRIPVTSNEVFSTGYNIFDLQHEYFVADSYDQLVGLLDGLEQKVQPLGATHV